MAAGLVFDVITDDGEWQVRTDMRDVMGWETYARKHGLPVRNVDGDNTFPQGFYMAHLGWTASTRTGQTSLSWHDWQARFQGAHVTEQAIKDAAESSGLPDPTQPAAGPDS